MDIVRVAARLINAPNAILDWRNSEYHRAIVEMTATFLGYSDEHYDSVAWWIYEETQR